MDAGLASTVLVAPLFLGGRSDLGLIVYATLVTVTAVAWTVNQAAAPARAPRASKLASVLLAAAVALVALQLAPLPADVIHVVSPGLAERLPAWGVDEESRFPEWATVSAHPWATRVGLATLIAHALLFLIAAGRVRTVADVTRVVRLVAIASVAMAVLALLQFASQTNELLWFYPLTYRDVSAAALGSFSTPNHCGHFLALGAGAGLYCLTGSTKGLGLCRGATGCLDRTSAVKKERVRSALWLAAVSAVVLSVLLTFSRGAAVALAASMTVACLMLVRAGWVRKQHMLGGLAAIVIGLIALSLGEYDAVSDEAGGVTVAELSRLADTSDRNDVWRANLAALAANPVLGFGVGSHPMVYRMFMAAPSAVLYTHAECGYLQVASETGLAGVTLLACAIGLTVAWCVRGACLAPSSDEQAIWAVISSAVATSLVHSTVDFVWYIPACVSPVVLLGACAARLTRLSLPTRDDKSNAAQLGAWIPRVALPAGGVASVLMLIGPASASLEIHGYEGASMALKKYAASSFAHAVAGDGQEAGASMVASQNYYTRRMVECLRRAERADPANPRTHLRLARLCVSQFELSQAAAGGGVGLDGVRDAALAARFGSREALDEWLNRAFGDASRLLVHAERHARCAVRLCPLQGEGYLYLADLRFLEPREQRDADALVAQALRVRPFDGGVLFDAGTHYLGARRHEEALQLWKESAGRPGAHRRKLASVVASIVPADVFIKEFKPDWALAHVAFEMYRRRGKEADMEALAQYAIAAAEQVEKDKPPSLAAHNWKQASAIQLSLGNTETAIQCAQRAHRLAPHRLDVRLALANSLYRAERYEDADPHIRWCLARMPDNKGLRMRLEKIAKLREEARPRMATAGRARWLSTSPSTENDKVEEAGASPHPTRVQ